MISPARGGNGPAGSAEPGRRREVSTARAGEPEWSQPRRRGPRDPAERGKERRPQATKARHRNCRSVQRNRLRIRDSGMAWQSRAAGQIRQMIILDTNVISALMSIRADEIVVRWMDQQPDSSIWTSAVTIFEIASGIAMLPNGRKRDRLRSEFDRFIEADIERRILPFNESAAEAAAMLVGTRRRGGRLGELRDTMIAGIAVAHRATLATRNTRHFDDLPVPVVNPW